MRIIVALLFFSLAAISPASAGQRATYIGSDGKRIAVEVADNGDARVGEAGAADYGLLRGGRFYIVGTDATGIRVVAVDDIAAAIDSVVSPIFGDALTRPVDSPGPLTAFRIVPTGQRRSVAGQEGEVHQVYGEDIAHPDRPVEWVISSAPQLAPAGRALEGYLIGALMPDAVFRGPQAGARAAQLRMLFARGTPITGDGLVLERFEQADVPAARVALPAAPLSRGQLLEAVRSAR